MKAQAIVTSQGRIVSLDIAVNYCHDMKLFKMSRRNIGQAGKILADSGYQGLMKIYPQAQTPRKSSKLKPLQFFPSTYQYERPPNVFPAQSHTPRYVPKDAL
ncbi:IS1381 transposase protein B [Streptococcus pneumoniae]|nr:IS1381 transposase protein B [Streptococcus pneumoniae]